MQLLDVLTLTRTVSDWLASSRHPRILHVFEHACNLVNERREVISIVTPSIGNGPFNLLVEDRILFSDALRIESPVSILDDQLNIASLTFVTAGAKYWSSRPNWERLHENREKIAKHLAALPVPAAQSPQPLAAHFIAALVHADVSSSRAISSQLAGLGIGLTPAGDDFMLGALYGSWILHPLDQAEFLAREVANTAAPLTTSLSAAWLLSAGRGEAGELWHALFDALAFSEHAQSRSAMEKLMSVGATSGPEALAGFLGTFQSYVESKKNHVVPRSIS
jgi:uncharacterized protein DUF2877